MIKKSKITQKNIIRSTFKNDAEVIKNALKLHSPKHQKVDVDPTFSKGNFYKDKVFKITEPKYKFDLKPQNKQVKKADSRNLPLENASVRVIVYDPPFISMGGSQRKQTTGKMRNRFSQAGIDTSELWEIYGESLQEFYRILKTGGIVIFKCQDCVSEGSNYFSHVAIMNIAYKLGFYPKDLFIKVSNTRPISLNQQKVQRHARKYHCYFWVFEKRKSKVDYN
jgi:hypothetical protein